jgi:hypothetical protein
MSFAAARAEKLRDSTQWSVADALRETLRQIEVGELELTSIVMVMVLDEGEEMRCIQRRYAGPESSRSEITHALTIALHQHVKDCV